MYCTTDCTIVCLCLIGPTLAGRALGMRRTGMIQPLHDPFEENALILYSPPKQTAHDQLKLNKSVLKFQIIGLPAETLCFLW